MRVRRLLIGVCLIAAACSNGDSNSTLRPATLPPVALRPPANPLQATPQVTAGVPSSGAPNDPNQTIAATATSTVPPPTDATTTSIPATSTTAPSTTTPSTTTTTLPPRPITLAFSGEILLQKGLWPSAARMARESGSIEPYDFSPMFADVEPLLAGADMAICHLESPIAPIGGELFSYPKYQVPQQLAPALAYGGYDACSTASEHVFDGGAEAVNATVAALEAQGILQSGMARTPDEIKPLPTEVGGVVVAHLAYTLRYDSKPNIGEEWRSALIDIPRIIEDARQARSLGAQAVILSIHWGNEDSARPTDEQRRWAEELTASGQIDVIVGAHSHVLQPIEQINGVWVMFSLGNFLTNMPTKAARPAQGQDGAIVTITLTPAPNRRVTVGQPVVYPTWVDKQADFTIRDLSVDLAANSAIEAGVPVARWNAARASLKRTRQILGDSLLIPGPYLED